jgi:hypothetical protein
VLVKYRRNKRNQIRELLSVDKKKDKKMSSSEKPAEQPHVSYYWNDVLEWERQAKAEEEAKLAQQREEEEKEQTKSAAAKDLLEALQEEQILDDLEIKQEIVLDPNE